MLGTLNGLLPDFGSSMTKSPETVTSQVKAKDPEEFAEKFSGNLFDMSFMDIDKGSMNIGGVTELSGYKLAEQLMSLVGTVIINWDAKGESGDGSSSIDDDGIGFHHGSSGGGSINVNVRLYPILLQRESRNAWLCLK